MNNHSVMFSSLESGYKTGFFTKQNILDSVSIGWITQAEANEILGITNSNSTASSANSNPNSTVSAASSESSVTASTASH